MGNLSAYRARRHPCLCTASGWQPPAACDADALLQLRVTNSGHLFWPDVVSPAIMLELRQAETARQVTDRYLLGLARRYGGRVVTCDHGLAVAGGDDVFDLLVQSS